MARSLLQRGDDISITADDRVYHGTFQTQDEEYVAIKGVIGDQIRKTLLIRKVDIQIITINATRKDD